MILDTMVARKSIETVNATFLSLLLLIYKLVLPRYIESNSELTSRIDAVMASQMLNSDNHSHNHWGTGIVLFPRLLCERTMSCRGLSHCFPECACEV